MSNKVGSEDGAEGKEMSKRTYMKRTGEDKACAPSRRFEELRSRIFDEAMAFTVKTTSGNGMRQKYNAPRWGVSFRDTESKLLRKAHLYELEVGLNRDCINRELYF